MSTLVITCECGYKILVVPDLAAMSQAIENHVLEHAKGSESPGDYVEANRIRDSLISQLFKKIADAEK